MVVEAAAAVGVGSSRSPRTLEDPDLTLVDEPGDRLGEDEMARIEGVDLPRNKRIDIALTYIFGIGRHTARLIIAAAEVEPQIRVQDLSEVEVARLRDVIQREHAVEGELRKEVAMNIKRLIDLGTYRGLRHKRGLPVRGQRTHTNARTRKGPKRLAGRRR